MPPQPLPSDHRSAADALTGRRVLITGAAQGLGRALALNVARLGATTILLDKHVEGLEDVYDEIEAAGGAQPALYPMDLLGATPQDYADLTARLQESLGGIDTVVHNAAVLGKPAPLAQYNIESWYRTVQVNLHAPFLLTRYCLPHLLRADRPRLLFISDVGGREGMPFYGAYGVSKWGLEGLMQTLAAELPDDTPLRLTSLDPGALHTLLRRQGYPAENSDRLPLPESVTEAAMYLLDPRAEPVQAGRYTV